MKRDIINIFVQPSAKATSTLAWKTGGQSFLFIFFSSECKRMQPISGWEADYTELHNLKIWSPFKLVLCSHPHETSAAVIEKARLKYSLRCNKHVKSALFLSCSYFFLGGGGGLKADRLKKYN